MDIKELILSKIKFMKTIVRIEHPFDGWGLWRSGPNDVVAFIDSAKCYSDLMERHRKFPNPTYQRDIEGFIPKEHFCAFKSIDQLQEWILPEEMKEIISLGFKVLLLDVSECLEGEYQIAFKKEHIVQSKDITEIFKA